jgi:ribosomal protein S18 acetylase RimI-like enzyme
MYRSWMTNRARDERSVFLVAHTDDGRVVGFLIGTAEREIPIYRLREFGFIHDVWVEPEYRNEGVARQMTMLAIEKFRAMGMKQVRLDTAAANDVGRSLFRACGFRPSVTEMLLEIS